MVKSLSVVFLAENTSNFYDETVVTTCSNETIQDAYEHIKKYTLLINDPVLTSRDTKHQEIYMIPKSMEGGCSLVVNSEKDSPYLIKIVSGENGEKTLKKISNTLKLPFDDKKINSRQNYNL